MNEDFRNRVLLPVFLPLLVVAGFIGFAFALSRVLLAVSETGSSLIALFVSLYLLAVAGLISARPRISSKALGVGLVVGLLAIGASGALAASAGMRDLHAEEHAEGEGAAEGEGEQPADDGATEALADAHVWVAVDIDFSDAPATIPAGDVTIGLDNQGGIVHNVVFEGQDVKVEAQGGDVATQEVTLQPGTYTYFCDVPGHRGSGMEGQVTVE